MTRLLVGRLRYQDVGLEQQGEILVYAVQNGLSLFISQYGNARSGRGGDCEISFRRDGGLRFLTLLQEAANASEKPIDDWQSIGKVPYDWSDQDDEGYRDGKVIIEAKRTSIRLAVDIGHEETCPPYVATLSPSEAVELVLILRSALVR